MSINAGDRVKIKATGATGKVLDVGGAGSYGATKDTYIVLSKGERLNLDRNEIEPVEKKTTKVVDKWFN